MFGYWGWVCYALAMICLQCLRWRVWALALTLVLISGAGAGADERQAFGETMQRARRVTDNGGLALAVEIYVKAVALSAQVDEAKRAELVGELLGICTQLLEQRVFEPPVRGLVALLGITSGDDKG
ncbi:MAG: hypothetical protein DRH76_10825, partial [Deltaproteobacteria bacterium]